jgi:hypothetical protein
MDLVRSGRGRRRGPCSRWTTRESPRRRGRARPGGGSHDVARRTHIPGFPSARRMKFSVDRRHGEAPPPTRAHHGFKESGSCGFHGGPVFRADAAQWRHGGTVAPTMGELDRLQVIPRIAEPGSRGARRRYCSGSASGRRGRRSKRRRQRPRFWREGARALRPEDRRLGRGVRPRVRVRDRLRHAPRRADPLREDARLGLTLSRVPWPTRGRAPAARRSARGTRRRPRPPAGTCGRTCPCSR